MAAIVPSTGGGFTTATDSSEIDFTISGRDITASLVNGSIASARLDSAVNTSLSLANSSVQPSNSVLTGITRIAALRLNNVAYLVSTSKPTVRSDGSALVTGDRWYKADDGTEWFWNGTYWLSSTEYTVGFASRSLTAMHTPSFTNTFFPDWDLCSQLFFTKYKNIYTLGTADASNYWEVGILRLWNAYDIGSIVRLNTPATEGVVTATLNVVGIIRMISGTGFGVRIFKIGNPSTLDMNQAWTYRRIAE